MRGMILWIGALSVFLPFSLWADDQHYQDFIVGDEAVGLGGAYTAIASDPSGGWYNPAGIVDVRNTSLSLSANLYGIQDSSSGETDFFDPEDAISKLSVVPSSAGFVQALGRTDMHGKRPYAIGMTLVVPSYRKFSVSEEGSYNDPALGLVKSGYNRSYTDSTLWAGFLGAMRMGAFMSMGVSLFLTHRSVQDAAHSFFATDFSQGEFHNFRTAMTELDFSNYALLMAVGIKIHLAPNLFLGAMVRSPSINVFSSGSLRFSRSRANGSDPASFLPTPESITVESATRINGEARVGMAYVLPNLLKISADISAHLPVSYTLLKVTDPVAKSALLIAPEVERSLVINGNLGADVNIANLLTIGIGAFTNFASTPNISRDADKPAPPHVNMYGGTLALGFASQHTLTRVGIMYAYGSGHDVHAVNQDQLPTDTQGFVRVPITQTYIYFFLSSTFRY